MISPKEVIDTLNGILDNATESTFACALVSHDGTVLESRERGINKMNVKVLAIMAMEMKKGHIDSKFSGILLQDQKAGIVQFHGQYLVVIAPKETEWSAIKEYTFI